MSQSDLSSVTRFDGDASVLEASGVFADAHGVVVLAASSFSADTPGVRATGSSNAEATAPTAAVVVPSSIAAAAARLLRPGNEEGPDPHYYLRNFTFALAWIAERYGDLLDEAEQAFLDDYAGLPRPSQALMVRMLMRKGPYFRVDSLHYAEIGDPVSAAAPLLALGWLDANPVLTLDALFAVLRQAELARVFAGVAPGKLSKARLLEHLRGLAQFGDARPWRQWRLPQGASDGAMSSAGEGAIEGADGVAAGAIDVVEVRIVLLVERLRLMFFGNLRQDWSEFVLADLGIFQYERVEFPAAARAFQHRSDIETYLRLQRLREQIDEVSVQTGEAAADSPWQAIHRALLAENPAQPWLCRRRDKLLFALGRARERQRDWEGALACYRSNGYPGARHRTMRVLEQAGADADALAMAEAALAAPESETEVQLLQRLVHRLRRRLGHLGRDGLAPARRPTVTTLDLRLARPQDGRSVEFVARDHLSCADGPVYYVENTLINALFGLLCWPAIFQPVAGAFFHPFQRGPADLHDPGFAAARRAAFDACLTQLDEGSHADTIRANWRAKAGLMSPFVVWGALDEALLDVALHCLPAAHLKLWFMRILADIKTNASGLPDLVRFWPAERRYELIEVKGPGDRLQDNQLRWIAYNHAHGIPVRVCRVAWQEQAA
ncbi:MULTISPECIES: VRR-NUC domain-containing protein [unclassified Achromobacter]|uniref:VRR-NUC domain-containing protein n=1 Tax=unclassified Achromobacter TaxID=2626865 RepID=UPI000B517EC7|nr:MULTISPECIES: VRR-NUC domain-containing protein [unclassified Achromobacter]OWT80097.1 nuclease [Achromobacter sp. HZ34]OWT81980.1 nuclease [Achromobacter sp. HZ28]